MQPTQAGLTLQVSTSAGAVLPGKPLSALLAAGGVGPSDLTRNKQLLSEAQELLKGAKVGCYLCMHACTHLSEQVQCWLIATGDRLTLASQGGALIDCGTKLKEPAAFQRLQLHREQHTWKRSP